MPRRLLITGGAGFIGTSLLRMLHADDQVLVVDNFHPQVHTSTNWTNPGPADVEVLLGDITETAVATQAAKFAPTTVVHLAAETGTGQSLLQSRRHAAVNVTGTATLMDALSPSINRPERIILTSSRAIYGEGLWRSADGESTYYGSARRPEQLERGAWGALDSAGNEGTPMPNDAASVEARPTNVYAATKLAQENLLRAWSTALGPDLAVLRLQNVYGAGQAVHNSYTGVLTYFARQALAHDQIEVFEGGDIVRDFVHVSDIARAIVSCVDRPSRIDATLDLGSGAARSLAEVARILADGAGAPPPKVTSQYRLGDVRAASANITEARARIGFVPRVDLTEGLSDLLAWVAHHDK